MFIGTDQDHLGNTEIRVPVGLEAESSVVDDHTVEKRGHAAGIGDHAVEKGGHTAEAEGHAAGIGGHTVETEGHVVEKGGHAVERGHTAGTRNRSVQKKTVIVRRK